MEQTKTVRGTNKRSIRLNPRNLNPRKIRFLNFYLFLTFFKVQLSVLRLAKRDVEFYRVSFHLCETFVRNVHLRKSYKIENPFSAPRKWARFWYHWKWFLKVYNLNYSDSNFINWVNKSLNFRNSTYQWTRWRPRFTSSDGHDPWPDMMNVERDERSVFVIVQDLRK